MINLRRFHDIGTELIAIAKLNCAVAVDGGRRFVVFEQALGQPSCLIFQTAHRTDHD